MTQIRPDGLLEFIKNFHLLEGRSWPFTKKAANGPFDGEIKRAFFFVGLQSQINVSRAKANWKLGYSPKGMHPPVFYISEW